MRGSSCVYQSGLTPIHAANKDRGQGRLDYGDHTTGRAGRRRWQKSLLPKSKSKLTRSRVPCQTQAKILTA
jgi:hypothetical protein